MGVFCVVLSVRECPACKDTFMVKDLLGESLKDFKSMGIV